VNCIKQYEYFKKWLFNERWLYKEFKEKDQRNKN
jgi:hypothetical protein